MGRQLGLRPRPQFEALQVARTALTTAAFKRKLRGTARALKARYQKPYA